MSKPGARRDTRLRACELAAQCLQGQLTEGAHGARLMALVIFFETYIDLGCDETERRMRLLRPKKLDGTKLRVVAGGGL